MVIIYLFPLLFWPYAMLEWGQLGGTIRWETSSYPVIFYVCLFTKTWQA